MPFVYLVISFLLLVYSRKIFIKSLAEIAGPNLTKKLYFLLFFPGIIIHELSHFFVASLLLVPTGKISFFPEEEKMASVQVAKTDPVRQTLIGLAPTIAGTAAILAIFFFALKLPIKVFTLSELFSLLKNTRHLPWLYLIFSINNTMFTSPQDRRPLFGFIAFLTFLATLLYLFNLLSTASQLFLIYGTTAAHLITAAYLSTFLINLVFITPLFISVKIVRK